MHFEGLDMTVNILKGSRINEAKLNCICKCHTCILACILAYILAYILTCILADILACILTCILAYILAYTREECSVPKDRMLANNDTSK